MYFTAARMIIDTYAYTHTHVVIACFNAVILSGGTGNPDFRGFMIQGRVIADDSPTGQFTGEAGVSQPQCADDVS